MQIKRFEHLAGTAEARLEGEKITGRFGVAPLLITNESRLCETFANSLETPAAILKFSKRYGPLVNVASPGGAFQFQLAEWRGRHQIFCDAWRSIARSYTNAELKRWGGLSDTGFEFAHGSHLSFSKHDGENTVTLDKLLDLIELCFYGQDWERLRVCGRPECTKKFFIAHHLKQSFCNDQECKDWGQRRDKLNWWNENRRKTHVTTKEG
jgi:hypothetical protein